MALGDVGVPATTQTVGISSKVLAGSITTAIVAPLVGLLADAVGLNIQVETATAIIGPLVLAAVVFVVGFLARADVVLDLDEAPVEEETGEG